MENSCESKDMENTIFVKGELLEYIIKDENSKENLSQGQFELLVDEFSEICRGNVLTNGEHPIKDNIGEFSNHFYIKDSADEARNAVEEAFETKLEDNNESKCHELGVIYESYEEATSVRVVCKKLSAYDMWRINSELSVSAHQCEICGEIFANKRSLNEHSKYSCIDDDEPSPHEGNLMSDVVYQGVSAQSNQDTLNDSKLKASDENPLNYTQDANQNGNLVNIIQNANRNDYFNDGSSDTTNCNGNLVHSSLNADKNTNFNNSTLSRNQNDSLMNFSCSPNINMRSIDFALNANDSDLLCYKCEICDKKIPLLSNLKLHLVSKHKKALRKCKHCDSMFPSLVALRQHTNSHPPNSQIKTRKCALCDMSFCDYSDLAIHSAKVHFSRSHECGICEIRFENTNLLNHHKILFHNGQGFKSSSGKISIRKKYKENPELRKKKKKKKSIIFRPKSSVSPEEAEVWRSGNKFYKCPRCDNLYSNMTLLNEHHVSHDPEEEKIKGKCFICLARFYTLDDLKAHESGTHFPFKCELCEKSFNYKSSLKLHQKLAHKSEKAIYKCDECKTGFKWHKSLLNHQLSSKCKVCEKCSKAPNSVCTNHGVYSCDHCGKSFASLRNLRRHMVLHAPKKCPFCAEKFADSKKMYEHSQQHKVVRREERKRQTALMRLRKKLEQKEKNKKIDPPVRPIIIKPGEKINDNVPTSVVTVSSLKRAFFKCLCGNLYSSVTLLNAHTATHLPQLET